MPRFSKVYMRTKKFARKGEGLLTSGGSKPAPAAEEPTVVPTVEELEVAEPEVTVQAMDEPEVAA